MKMTTRPPAARRQILAAGKEDARDLRRAAIIATDRASKDAQRALQNRIRGVGLGRLGGAVGQTSSARRKISANDNPYGVLFARGGDESSAGGALEAYSRGATITAKNGQWLAFPTRSVPKYISVGGRRRRLTPDLYERSNLVASIGKLVFIPTGPNRAVLVIPRARVSVKTGRAKAPGKRRSKTMVNQRDVVAFVLLRVTRRAQRFDKDDVIRPFARQMPAYMLEALDQLRRGRA